jgi:hypothetical protein
MALTLQMEYTNAVLLILHPYFAMDLMGPIQDLSVKFHSQIFQMDILKLTTYLVSKLIFRTARPTYKILIKIVLM